MKGKRNMNQVLINLIIKNIKNNGLHSKNAKEEVRDFFEHITEYVEDAYSYDLRTNGLEHEIAEIQKYIDNLKDG